jgi:alpha-tubulin suppressor-like RCC1 family protein
MAFVKVAAGNNFAIGIIDPGTLTLWGTNARMKEAFVMTETAKDVFAGKDIAFVITTDGRLYGFGSTDHERLPIPLEITAPKFVSVQDDSVIVLEESGQLKAWGTGLQSLVPTQLFTSKVKSISRTGTDFAALLENGTLVQWSSKSSLSE